MVFGFPNRPLWLGYYLLCIGVLSPIPIVQRIASESSISLVLNVYQMKISQQNMLATYVQVPPIKTVHNMTSTLKILHHLYTLLPDYSNCLCLVDCSSRRSFQLAQYAGLVEGPNTSLRYVIYLNLSQAHYLAMKF